MERVNMDFGAVQQEVIALIKKSTTWVLASAADHHVTARTVFTVGNGVVIFFQTDRNFIKDKRMFVNPYVTLCRDNYQIEGKAKEIGHPPEMKNSAISRRFRQQHPPAYKRYSELETETLFEAHPPQVPIWKQMDEQAYREPYIISTM